MAREWIKDIRAVYSDSEIAEDINNLKIENKNLLDRNYEPASEDYFDIYKLKFYPNYDDGYFYLEKAMENAHPGFGYCHLANILADTRHNLVITTNFDSLTEDALFVYTDKKPIVVGHESLADYARINSSRPVIAKINRGLSLTR